MEIQGTPEWFEKRIGKLTASNMSLAMDFLKKGGESKERYNLKMNILSERLTGQFSDIFISKPMLHGKETEEKAKAILSAIGYSIEEAGFIDHPIIKNFGASPDGFLKDGGVLEIKCPTTKTHLEWIIQGVVPEQHKPQMISQLACSGKKWCEFVSFDDRIKEKGLRLFIRRFVPSESEIKLIENHAKVFLKEVDELQSQMEFYSL